MFTYQTIYLYHSLYDYKTLYMKKYKSIYMDTRTRACVCVHMCVYVSVFDPFIRFYCSRQYFLNKMLLAN